MCEAEFDYRDGYKHECFDGIPMDQLQIVGNVLKKNSSCHEFQNEEEDNVEYLDQFQNVGSLKIFSFLHYLIAWYFHAILVLFHSLGNCKKYGNASRHQQRKVSAHIQ